MVEVVYKDVAPYSKKDSVPSATDINISLSDITDLKNENLTAKNYGTLERNRWRLDGTFQSINDNPENMGWWSSQISNDSGIFESPIVLIRTFSQKHTAVGIEFVFDKFCNEYVNSLNVKWYNDDTLLFDKNYTPDTAQYYCKQNVESFNKIIVTFYSTNKPNRFLKIYGIEDGTLRTFKANELKEVKILEEQSPISEDISINTLNFSIDSKDDTDYIFQKRQPIEVTNDNDLLGVFYVESSERKTKSQYSISSEDYTGILDKVTFKGGIYDNVSVKTLIDSVMLGENITYTISDDIKDFTLSGYLPICTKREALSQILFACGGVLNASRIRGLQFYKLTDETAKAVDEKQIFSGGKIKSDNVITAVTVSYHQYEKGDTAEKIWNGLLSLGDNYIELSDIIDPETAQVGSNAQIKEAGANYLIIYSATETKATAGAKKYTDNVGTYTKANEDVVSGTAENIITVDSATLVSPSNVKAVCDMVYNHYIHNQTLETKIVINNERVGDKITLKTEWSGEKAGRITKLEYDVRNKLIGNVVQKIG